MSELQKCQTCGTPIPLRVDMTRTSWGFARTFFILCLDCYVHMRKGYQRDRDRTLRLISEGAIAIGSTHLIGSHDNG